MMLASQAIAAEEAGMGSLSEALTAQVEGIQEGERRKLGNEATKEFKALGDNASFDDWFKIADKYGDTMPGLADAIQADMAEEVKPGSPGSRVLRIIKSFVNPFGWGEDN